MQLVSLADVEVLVAVVSTLVVYMMGAVLVFIMYLLTVVRAGVPGVRDGGHAGVCCALCV